MAFKTIHIYNQIIFMKCIWPTIFMPAFFKIDESNSLCFWCKKNEKISIYVWHIYIRIIVNPNLFKWRYKVLTFPNWRIDSLYQYLTLLLQRKVNYNVNPLDMTITFYHHNKTRDNLNHNIYSVNAWKVDSLVYNTCPL